MSHVYRSHFHSLVRWTKAFIDEAAAELALDPKPTYVNLDAYGQEEELPPGDLVGLSDYALSIEPAETQVFISWTVSTQADPDLVRHVDLIDALVHRLRPGASQIPVWTVGGAGVVQTSWMLVAGQLDVEPMAQGRTGRGFQSVSAHLMSGLTGAA